MPRSPPSDKTSTTTSSSSSPPPPPPPPPSSSSSWTELAAREEAEALATAAAAAESHAKPFSTPPGYKAPSLGEQFAYAARRHPYSRLGYAAVFLTGCGVWWLASGSVGGGVEERGKGKGKEAEAEEKKKTVASGAKS